VKLGGVVGYLVNLFLRNFKINLVDKKKAFTFATRKRKSGSSLRD
jgi:hypothetical protein